METGMKVSFPSRITADVTSHEDGNDDTSYSFTEELLIACTSSDRSVSTGIKYVTVNLPPTPSGEDRNKKTGTRNKTGRTDKKKFI